MHLQVTGRAARLIACCLAVLTVGGCAGTRPPTAAAPTPSSLPATGPATLTADALDLVTQSGTWPATEGTLNAANDILVARCMAAHGLRFSSTAMTVTDNGNENAVVNLAGRRLHGYGLASGNPDELAGRPQDAYVASLSAADRQHYLEVLFGPDSHRVTVNLPDGGQATLPGEGCQADAIRALAGDLTRWGLISYLPQQLGNRLADQLGTAAGYRAAMARWRTCMAARGMRYPDPDHAVSALRLEYQTSGATPALRSKEIATAVADGECALAARLPLAALASRRALAVALPEQDRRNLVTLADDRNAAVRRARAILGQG